MNQGLLDQQMRSKSRTKSQGRVNLMLRAPINQNSTEKVLARVLKSIPRYLPIKNQLELPATTQVMRPKCPSNPGYLELVKKSMTTTLVVTSTSCLKVTTIKRLQIRNKSMVIMWTVLTMLLSKPQVRLQRIQRIPSKMSKNNQIS